MEFLLSRDSGPQSLLIMALKVLGGVFLSWVAVGIVGIILAARSPAALRLGESDIRAALFRYRGAPKSEPPLL